MISTTEKTTPNITTPSLNITLTKKPMNKAISLQLCALAVNKEPDNPELQVHYGTQLLAQDIHFIIQPGYPRRPARGPCRRSRSAALCRAGKPKQPKRRNPGRRETERLDSRPFGAAYTRWLVTHSRNGSTQPTGTKPRRKHVSRGSRGQRRHRLQLGDR